MGSKKKKREKVDVPNHSLKPNLASSKDEEDNILKNVGFICA
jgi:hypothetical protein